MNALKNCKTNVSSSLSMREIAAQMLELVKGIEWQPFQHTLKAMGY